MPLVLISSDRFAEHQTPPGHPERPERAEAMDVVAARWRKQGAEVLSPRPATHDELACVHDARYLRRVAETAGRAVALDPDTFTSPESHEIALLAAGAALMAVERAMHQPTSALALVRPPGHHAERNRAMGFCLFNNVAVGAAYARARGATRVAIVDYDVHHGNGTQHTFEADPHVLYISTHQFPYYPGTGAANEVGRGAGQGFTVNLPLEVGAVDEDYRTVFSDVVVPVLLQFEPDLMMIYNESWSPLSVTNLGDWSRRPWKALARSWLPRGDDLCAVPDWATCPDAGQTFTVDGRSMAILASSRD